VFVVGHPVVRRKRTEEILVRALVERLRKR
jgi:hypothetical protein